MTTKELIDRQIRIEKKIIKNNIIDNLKTPVIYSPSSYGIMNKCTGKNVKIAILDTGCPNHKDININGDKININVSKNIDDKDGHSTMIAGLINANNKHGIIGLAPNATLLFCKVSNNRGNVDFNSLIAGVLWAVVKKVDIIVIAMGTQYDHVVLRDAIKKALNQGICVIAAAGDENVDENWQIDYPAKFKGVFSAGFLTKGRIKNKIIKEKTDFYLKNKGLCTTYLNNKYIKMSGSSISAAFFAGLAAVLVEQYKKEKIYNINEKVYENLLRITNI